MKDKLIQNVANIVFFFFVLEDNTKKFKSIDFFRKNHMHIKAKKSWKMMEFLFLEYGI